MFIPFIPKANHIINKTVLYCDGILTIDTNNDEIKVTHINNVPTWDYKNHINKVCNSNPNIIFHTIQYSAQFQKLTFYTFGDLNLSEYYAYVDNQNNDSQPNKTLGDICENILNDKTPFSGTSLYTFYRKMEEYRLNCKTHLDYLTSAVNQKMMDVSDSCEAHVYQHSFDYIDNVLVFYICQQRITFNYMEMRINKTKQGKLNIVSTKEDSSFCYPLRDLFNESYEEINKLYEFYVDYYALIGLIPKNIFYKEGIVAKIHYSPKSFIISIENQVPLKNEVPAIQVTDNNFNSINMDYESFKKVKSREVELFMKLLVPDEDIKDLDFIFQEKKTKATKGLFFRLKKYLKKQFKPCYFSKFML